MLLIVGNLSLLKSLNKSGGRNNTGRITTRHIGGGHKRAAGCIYHGTIEQVEEHLKDDFYNFIKEKYIIFCKDNARTTIAKQMHETIEQQAAEMNIISLGATSEAVAVKEAQALQMSIYEYAPNSKPARQYLELFEKIAY